MNRSATSTSFADEKIAKLSNFAERVPSLKNFSLFPLIFSIQLSGKVENVQNDFSI